MSSSNFYGMGMAQLKQEGMTVEFGDCQIGISDKLWVDEKWYNLYRRELKRAQQARTIKQVTRRA